MKNINSSKAIKKSGQKEYRILSGSVLKMTALITMLIDHTASVILREMSFATVPLITVGKYSVSYYVICRLIGRLAFPIYAFLITEGYLHTRNKRNYGLRLLIFAIISEIPWNLEHKGSFFYSSQNVFFTLFFGYLAICCYERFKDRKVWQVFSLVLLFLVSFVFKADYGFRGLGFILLLYLLRDKKVPQAVVGCCFFTNPIPVLISFVPINLYSGKRGFIKGRAAKYIFYAAYPVHLLILYFIKKNLFGY